MYICIRKGVLAKSKERTIFFTSEKKKCPIRIAYEVFHMCQEWYVQSKATTVREFCAKSPAFLWVQCHRFSSYFALQKLACEQAFRSALASGREKEGELATTSLKFEYLHRKSRCEMLIGGDDITHDVITLGKCFSMFVYIRAPFPFALIDGNLTV